MTVQTHLYSPTELANQSKGPSQLLFTRWRHLKSAQFHWLTPNQTIASNKDAMDRQSKISIFNSTNNNIKDDGEELLVNKPWAEWRWGINTLQWQSIKVPSTKKVKADTGVVCILQGWSLNSPSAQLSHYYIFIFIISISQMTTWTYYCVAAHKFLLLLFMRSDFRAFSKMLKIPLETMLKTSQTGATANCSQFIFTACFVSTAYDSSYSLHNIFL